MAKDALVNLGQTVANLAVYAATLEAQRDTAREQVATVTAERDQAIQNFQTLAATKAEPPA